MTTETITTGSEPAIDLPDAVFHALIDDLMYRSAMEPRSPDRDLSFTEAVLAVGIRPKSWDASFMSDEERQDYVRRIRAEGRWRRT